MARALALLSFTLLALLAGEAARTAPGPAGGGAGRLEGRAPEGGPFEAEAWNRVHRALFHRVGSDGARYGADALDPLLWAQSTWLLREPAATRLADALAALAADAEALAAASSAARVVMQRDLLAAHDWLFARGAAAGSGAAAEAGQLALAGRLRAALAAAARGVALAPEEARALEGAPWAARAARAAGEAGIDVLELLAEDGPWLRLASGDDPHGAPLAPAHVEAFAARSVFSVHLRLPEGREAAARYLALLAAADATETRGGERYLARELPRLPLGSTLALVRRALHVDAEGQLHATPLVELVQARTIASDRWPDGASSFDPDFWRAQQSVLELVLDRGALLSGGPGLRAIGAGEARLELFGGHGSDPLEPGGQRAGPPGAPTLTRCAGCHGAPGIHSMASFTGVMSGPGTHLEVPLRVAPRALAPDPPGGAASRALAARRARPEHRALLEGWAQ